MTTINKHVEDYLDYFSNLPNSPEYAVLIKGKWGVGKTWFVKKYCDKLKNDGRKFLYVSLYGKQSTAEIEVAFFQQLHPVLASKGMKLLGSLSKSILKGALKVDLDNDNKDDDTLSIQIPDGKFLEDLKNIENRIIIFDDLERCAIPIVQLLGYINFFVEHQGLKIIIVANEEEIESSNDNSDKSEKSYLRIKEKLIGKTFEILPDFDNAATSIIEALTSENLKNYLKTNTTIIKQIFLLSECHNFRILKQSLWDFERLYNCLEKGARQKDDFVKQLLQMLLALSFEIKQGKLAPKNLNKLNSYYYPGLLNEEKTEYTEVFKKYSHLNIFEPIIDEQALIEFFDKGIMDKITINESIRLNKYFYNEQTPTWMKLWHHHDLTDEEFEDFLAQVVVDFKNRQYKDTGVIKHIIGLLLRFSEADLYKKEKKAILQEGKNYINYLKTAGILKAPEKKPWLSDSYQHLGFAAAETNEFKEFTAYIEEKEKEVLFESLPAAGKELLQSLTDDFDLFCRRIHLCNSEDQIYWKIPIFAHIEPLEFVNAYLSLPSENRRAVMQVFNKRYEDVEIAKILCDELKWLKQISTLLKDEYKKRKGKLSEYIYKAAIRPSLEQNIKKLEKSRSK